MLLLLEKYSSYARRPAHLDVTWVCFASHPTKLPFPSLKSFKSSLFQQKNLDRKILSTRDKPFQRKSLCGNLAMALQHGQK